MDISRFFAAISCLILLVCLTLSVTTLVVLRNAIDETEQVKEDAKQLIGELDQSLNRLEIAVNANAEQEQELPTNAGVEEPYLVRACNGKIGVYTASGILVDWIDVNIILLPKAAREALEEGIEVESLDALQRILMDYTS